MTIGHDRSDPSRRARKRVLGNRPLPLGEGVIVRALRIEPAEQVRLGSLLAGYDGLGSLHGDGDSVVIVSTASQAEALDEALASIGRYGVRFQVMNQIT
jgi:hypothetical protein